jgi:hypothetical protein
MPLTVEHMLAEFQGNPPSERAIIEQAERQAGFAFPADYRDFLLKQNGVTPLSRRCRARAGARMARPTKNNAEICGNYPSEGDGEHAC